MSGTVDSAILRRGREMRDNCQHLGLPDGYSIRLQKNGRWVGKYRNGDIKSTDGDYVEAFVWCMAGMNGDIADPQVSAEPTP